MVVFQPKEIQFGDIYPIPDCYSGLDELVFDVHNSELEKIQSMIKHEMENAFKMAVPLDVEIGLGKNWLEAH